jgi:hypothetical protein
VDEWFVALCRTDPLTADLVEAAIDVLAVEGPSLGRPLADRVKGSRLHNLKELRPASRGGTETRILFAFDPVRRAILLVAGGKADSWKRWYDSNIPLAEDRYEKPLAAEEDR